MESRHVPARPGRAAGRSPARKQGKAPTGTSTGASTGATSGAAGRGEGAALAGRGTPAPAPETEQVIKVARPVIHALGMDLESVKVTTAGRRRLLRVVVDSTTGSAWMMPPWPAVSLRPSWTRPT